MNVIIHDLEKEQFKNLPFSVDENTIIIADDKPIKNCIGCFSCWIKTPGQCIIKDKYQDIGKILAGATQVTVISKLLYGGYSPFVNNGFYEGRQNHIAIEQMKLWCKAVNLTWGQAINWPRFLWRIQSSTLVWYPRAKANGLNKQAMFKRMKP